MTALPIGDQIGLVGLVAIPVTPDAVMLVGAALVRRIPLNPLD